MKINGKTFRTIWLNEESQSVDIIDQTRLPFELKIVSLNSMREARDAIRDMLVRGAPLVGATAAYGLALAMRENPSDKNLEDAAKVLFDARPTAVNLQWAIAEQRRVLEPLDPAHREAKAFEVAAKICDEDVQMCSDIGDAGAKLISTASQKKGGEVVNLLTHCNAGWLATVDWGTALAPIYKAHDAGIKVHVWVDETRPRNQGAYLTAFELGQHGVPHTVVVDNAGGHLMQRGLVDMCFVGTDRTTRTGDVCNKIGTYLKALAADANGVPFYVCAPSPSIDFELEDGVKDIPIEQRAAREVSHIIGRTEAGEILEVNILPEGSEARNDAFDVTPARYITGLVTERGLVDASDQAISALFSERLPAAAQ